MIIWVHSFTLLYQVVIYYRNLVVYYRKKKTLFHKALRLD